ncbi:hypothetical protein Abu_1771 [Aliarcobacter butzleri RM4018]|uniref:DUF2914 domain-containing protein n=2 Tax=Aliarcobacter butzleri TaxID=28197 RepID=A8EVP4_ALIB4|nr:hypothetical protein [Aliarcobacter butzleri]ABV68017.1 hypothetical protein Abu_1771 [Aliarcobacter butzleri RM4018]MCG3663841.1 hypothetical protein [Aliarcobacter butzleri]MCR8711097.1 hypothetical protein [Aliarcobacter butzleri]MDN5114864.1 hypothetical protein [Aliarcobacter butzleri]RZV12952.1 hypothetical protein D3M61_10385 [Aliarcobacter butzleri]
MIKFLIPFLLCMTIVFAESSADNNKKIEDTIQKSYNPNVDCLILEDENSIICKFEVIKDSQNEQKIVINWVNPNGEISRTREMLIPAGDSSAYDFRYLDGRESGKWDFKIIYDEKEYSTSFELK